MTRNEPLITDLMKCDIAVVGGGGSGLAAAVAASEKGANVIVLEKRSSFGGNTMMAEGLFASESRTQKRMMIDARSDKLFRIAMDYAHWKLDARIIRAFIDKSADTIDWLEKKNLKLDSLPQLYPNQVPLVWHCTKSAGAEIVAALINSCKDLGVQLINQTAVLDILTDENNKVIGVKAKKKDHEFKVMAKSVIIATGGYGGNKKLLKKYSPSYKDSIYCRGIPHKGDGLTMALKIGATTEGLGLLQLGGPFFRGAPHVGAVAREPNTIWVNKMGERFTDETITYRTSESGNTINRQPDKTSFTLFDTKIKHKMVNNGLFKRNRIIFHTLNELEPKFGKNLEKELLLEEKKGQVKIANSWHEIAEWIGAPPDVLQATIDEYNSFCNKGHDKIFTKDLIYLDPLRKPPFYAIKCGVNMLGTIGGIKINHHMQVLDSKFSPIPGLYAVGVDTGGWESDTYNAILSGSTLGFAINSGRIAGENSTKYALTKV
jgi:fumarate reductase flavoprotein subunit